MINEKTARILIVMQLVTSAATLVVTVLTGLAGNMMCCWMGLVASGEALLAYRVLIELYVRAYASGAGSPN